MHEYRLHTLVDITNNGNLKMAFPFKTDSGDVVHDKHSLAIARNQNSNFNTMLQLLQMRGNITWDHAPKRLEFDSLGNSSFGSFYEGKHSTWHFQFFTEQSGVFGDHSNNHVGYITEDFDLVPILSFCKETVTFPVNSFLTQDHRTINTYFTFAGETNK